MNNYYGDHFRWFVGIVKEVVDQTYVKVRIFGVHPISESELDSSDLPLATVLYPTTGPQLGSGHSNHNLQVDSWVVGFSPDDSFLQPIIFAVIQGTDYSMSAYSSSGGKFVGDNDVGDPGEIDSGATANIPGDSNPAKVYNYVYQKLVEEGDSDPHMHASALVGCLQLESGPSLDPQITNSIGAYGICQWLTKSRQNGLWSKYGRHPSLANQCDFMWWELNNTHNYAKKKWLAGNNLPDAVAGFCWFEGAEEISGGRLNRSHGNYKKRLQYAYKIYNSMSKNSSPSQPSQINSGYVV